ncbi:hypothetical protein GCM10022417_13120 [Corynebacterium pilbarense]
MVESDHATHLTCYWCDCSGCWRWADRRGRAPPDTSRRNLSVGTHRPRSPQEAAVICQDPTPNHPSKPHIGLQPFQTVVVLCVLTLISMKILPETKGIDLRDA